MAPGEIGKTILYLDSIQILFGYILGVGKEKWNRFFLDYKKKHAS